MSDISENLAAAASDAPETVATYLRLRGLKPSTKNWKRKHRAPVDDDNAPFTPGRDPGSLGAVLDRLTKDAGWQSNLAREDVILQWDQLAGADTAKHSEPVSLERGLLTVKCDSTAWAKNLQYMRATILTEIGRRYPDAGVQNLRFIWAGRSLLEMGPQSRSRAGSTRYLRVGDQIWGPKRSGGHTRRSSADRSRNPARMGVRDIDVETAL